MIREAADGTKTEELVSRFLKVAEVEIVDRYDLNEELCKHVGRADGPSYTSKREVATKMRADKLSNPLGVAWRQLHGHLQDYQETIKRGQWPATQQTSCAIAKRRGAWKRDGLPLETADKLRSDVQLPAKEVEDLSRIHT